MLYKVVLTFESVDKILKCSLAIQMKVTEHYFPEVMFTMVSKVALTFQSMVEILKSEQLLYGALYTILLYKY